MVRMLNVSSGWTGDRFRLFRLLLKPLQEHLFVEREVFPTLAVSQSTLTLRQCMYVERETPQLNRTGYCIQTIRHASTVTSRYGGYRWVSTSQLSNVCSVCAKAANKQLSQNPSSATNLWALLRRNFTCVNPGCSALNYLRAILVSMWPHKTRELAFSGL